MVLMQSSLALQEDFLPTLMGACLMCNEYKYTLMSGKGMAFYFSLLQKDKSFVCIFLTRCLKGKWEEEMPGYSLVMSRFSSVQSSSFPRGLFLCCGSLPLQLCRCSNVWTLTTNRITDMLLNLKNKTSP